MIQIKLVTNESVLELQKISTQTFLETFAEVNSASDMKQYLNEAMTVEQLELELNNTDSKFYFAIQNQDVIGYLKINIGNAQTEHFNQKAFEIERIYVLKNYIGKQVGKLLFDTAIALAKKLQKKTVWLGVWEKNERAINFYQKNGFIKFDSHKFKLGNDIQTDILMALELK